MPKIEKVNVFQYQADAVLSQTDPVSTTIYTVLDTTKNVRILSVSAKITWATTQPTPMDILVTIDGQTITFRQADPVSNTIYEPCIRDVGDALQGMAASGSYTPNRAFFLEGRSVKIEIRITWATTQPTPLVSRVKYAKIP